MTVAANHPERRALPVEVRARGRRLEGYAATFGLEARISEHFSETIESGAFTTTLARGRDVLALVDHDPSRILARTRSRTLRLAQDSRGLAFDLDVPDTSTGRDVLALAERGDIGGMSFGFHATEEDWQGERRSLRAVELFEVSVVLAFPAYEGTAITARSQMLPAVRRDLARRYLDIIGA
ncbi:HK97 family phage prohead protease [Fulvimarina sp. MAC3]|uniref:HK97 family phage prohead protease n=1 Tax=Fulvimarina sp. MAC3 TaxID=3148887 RepID=UPI0031FDEB39